MPFTSNQKQIEWRNKNRKLVRAYNRRRYKRRKLNKQCVCCTNKVTKYTLCLGCRVKETARKKKKLNKPENQQDQ